MTSDTHERWSHREPALRLLGFVFEEFVDLMRERMFDADALFPSRLHD
jgi:hypothetical protein